IEDRKQEYFSICRRNITLRRVGQRFSRWRYRLCGKRLPVCYWGGVQDRVCGESGCWPEGRRGACGRHEQERHLNAFCCEAVSVTVVLAIQQAMAFEFAEIVAELVQPVRLRRELERGEDG